MEIVVTFRDDFPLEILPGAAPDAIASVEGNRAIYGLRTEIGPPGLAARAGQRLEPDAPPPQAFDQLDQFEQRPAQPVESPG